MGSVMAFEEILLVDDMYDLCLCYYIVICIGVELWLLLGCWR